MPGPVQHACAPAPRAHSFHVAQGGMRGCGRSKAQTAMHGGGRATARLLSSFRDPHLEKRRERWCGVCGGVVSLIVISVVFFCRTWFSGRWRHSLPSSGAKALVEKCLELQRALVEMAEKLARGKRARARAEDEVRALNEYVEVLMTKMSAVKTPGQARRQSSWARCNEAQAQRTVGTACERADDTVWQPTHSDPPPGLRLLRQSSACATTLLLLVTIIRHVPWALPTMWASAAPATSPKTDGGILHITGRDMFDHVMPSDEFWVFAVGSSLDGSNRTAQLALERAMDDLAEIPSLPFRLAIADADEYVEGTDGDDLLFREQHAKSLASGTPALLLYQYGLKGLDTTLPLGPSAIKGLVQEAKHKAKKKSKSKKKRRKIVQHMRRELLDMLGTFFPSKVVEVKGVGRLRKDNSWAKKQKTRKSKSGHPDGAPILTGPVALAMLVDAYSDSKLHQDRVDFFLNRACSQRNSTTTHARG